MVHCGWEDLHREVLEEFEDEITDRLQKVIAEREKEIWQDHAREVREEFEEQIQQAIRDRLNRR